MLGKSFESMLQIHSVSDMPIYCLLKAIYWEQQQSKQACCSQLLQQHCTHHMMQLCSICIWCWFSTPKSSLHVFWLIYNAPSPRQICSADFPFLNNNTNKHGNKSIVWGTLPLILFFDGLVDLLWRGIKSEVNRSLILNVVNLPFA